MADAVGLHELVGSVAGAIVEAQGQVEQHYLDRIGAYFDNKGRPHCFDLKLPKAVSVARVSAGEAAGEPPVDFVQLSVPFLALVESSMLAITELEMKLDVELGALGDPTEVPSATPMPAAAPSVTPFTPAPPGAPRDVPAIAIDSGDRARTAQVEAQAQVQAQAQQAQTATRGRLARYGTETPLAVNIGGRRNPDGPSARLTIKVAAQPPSEAMLRLITQLNKLV